MRLRSLLVWALVAVLLGGCGSGQQSPALNGGGQTPASVLVDTTALTAVAGGTADTTTGHLLSVPPGGLTQDTTVTLTVLSGPPVQPADPDFRSVGQYLEVDLGQADTTQNVTITLPYQVTDTDSTYAQVIVGNLVVPVETTVDAKSGQLVATFNPQQLEAQTGVLGRSFDGSNFMIGPATSSNYDDRPAHVNWPSWNAYVFRNGAFQPIVRQGFTNIQVPDLGHKPAVLVHGFGSDAARFTKLAQALLDNGYSSVIAFEYDTLSPVDLSGPFVGQFYAVVTKLAPGLQWHHVAHSMGALVSRKNFETSTPPYQTNHVVLVGGANAGSPIVDALKANQSYFDLGMRYLVSNNLIDFRNADGTPCKVSITDPGFQDLATTSAVVTQINMNAATKHPHETYRTVAGTNQGQFKLANTLLGVKPEDGVIALSSANANFIGAVESAEEPFDHTTLVDDTTQCIPQILEFLNKN